MTQKEYKRNWSRKNKHLCAQYREKYIKDKTQASIVLEAWVKEEIDKVKNPEMPYGGWIRKMVEEWAALRKEQGLQ